MNNQEGPKKVFISYSTRNGEIAQHLVNALESSNISCWIAPRDIASSESWADEIMKGLNQTEVFLMLVSEDSLKSNEVAKEIDIANSSRKKMLPVRIENVPLRGAAQYHLSNKQWVDVLEGDKSERGEAVVKAVASLIGSAPTPAASHAQTNAATQNTLAHRARHLADELNRSYSDDLDTINSTFGQWGDDQAVSVVFPVSLGATGLTLFSHFNRQTGRVFIFADNHSDGDPLNHYFIAALNSRNEKDLPRIERNKGARRWKVFTLLPETSLGKLFPGTDPATLFDVYAQITRAYYRQLMPWVIKWLKYGKEVQHAIEQLQDRLQEIFPESAGWRILAPEGWRLQDFRSWGTLHIFKESWEPKWDNHRKMGHLSLCLRTVQPMLHGLHIGLVKYEGWYDLDDYATSLIETARPILGSGTNNDHEWAFFTLLPEPWRNSGLQFGHLETFPWQGKFDEWITFIADTFAKLKEHLEPLIDAACTAIPSLQDKDPQAIQLTQDATFAASPHYVRNRLRLLAEKLQDQYPSAPFTLRWRFRNGSVIDILLHVKEAKFEVALACQFNDQTANLCWLNLEEPDFESAIAKRFIAARFPELKFTELKRLPSTTLPDWLDHVDGFITAQVAAYEHALIALTAHLKQCSELVQGAKNALAHVFPESDSWVIEDDPARGASSLIANSPIRIWNRKWQVNSSLTQNNGCPMEYPPVLLELVPMEPCFEKLCFSISYNGRQQTKTAEAIQQLNGAIFFALGAHKPNEDPPLQGLLAARLLPPEIRTTGGSDFSQPIRDGESAALWQSRLSDFFSIVLRIEPMITTICQKENQLACDEEFSP
jgi:hypothetical protein